MTAADDLAADLAPGLVPGGLAPGLAPDGLAPGGLAPGLAPDGLAPDGLAHGKEFFDRVRRRLSLDVPAALHDPEAPAVRGDLDLNPETWTKLGVAAVKPAAVLIAVVERQVPTVILTRRTDDLPSHAGQIAFPGGKIDAEDATPAGAALREAWEEIGLDRTLVEPIGYLDLYLTFSGFRILPTVARVEPGFVLTPNRGEVADIFEVPLAFLTSPDNHLLKSREWKGMIRHYYEISYQDRIIWGVTAGILRNLYDRICRE
jgi:8-oxo-dGTP pyrophosphatase MutT (NUDIX family)